MEPNVDLPKTEQVDVSTAPESPPESQTMERDKLEPAQGHTISVKDLNAYYGERHAIKGISLEFAPNQVTAIIGPSGCGKSTLVRCINRMHEEIPKARAEGTILLDDEDIYGPHVDVTAVRRQIGMVFQKANPFPTMSIFDNVASGLRLSSRGRGDLHGQVEAALREI